MNLEILPKTLTINKYENLSKLSINDFLIKWAVEYFVPRNAVTALFHKLNELDATLPLDSRTLLKTLRSTD